MYSLECGTRRRRGINYNVANYYWHGDNREISLNHNDRMFHQFRVSGTLLFPTLHSRTDKFQYFISHINISWVWSIIRAGKVLPHVIRHFSHKIKKINKNNSSCPPLQVLQSIQNIWHIFPPTWKLMERPISSNSSKAWGKEIGGGR